MICEFVFIVIVNNEPQYVGKKTFISKWGTESELLEWVLEKMEE